MTPKPDVVDVFAQAFIDEFGDDWTARPEQVAARLGLRLVELSAERFEGALLRVKNGRVGTIVINKDIPEASRRRFTLAHELGHYLLPNQQDLLSPCTGRVIEQWGSSVSAAEQEANRFAAAILMPTERLLPVIKAPPSFTAIQNIAQVFGTSLSASAYRYCERTSFRVAVVWSEQGKARWYKASTEFERYVRLGDLDDQTFAADYFRGESVPDHFESVPATAWFYEQGLREDARIWEHSLWLPNYDATLTLLYIKEPIEHEDEEDPALDPEEFSMHRKRWPTKR
jgi:Zn-dependent peptidase ImmA (M78 family)